MPTYVAVAQQERITHCYKPIPFVYILFAELTRQRC